MNSNTIEEALDLVKKNGQSLQNLNDELRNNKEIVLAAINQYCYALRFASEQIKSDQEVVFSAVNQNPLSLQYASEKLLNDRQFIKMVVKKDGMALQYVGENLQTDKELVLLALSNNGMALKYVNNELREDVEVISTALKQEQMAMEFVSYAKRAEFGLSDKYFGSYDGYDNRDVVLFASKKDISLLQYASKRILNDKKFILDIVKHDGMGLQYASKNLQGDLDVILTAIGQNKSSMRFVNYNKRNLLNDSYKYFGSYTGYDTKSIVLKAIEKDGLLLQYASDKLINDKQLVLVAVKNDGMALQFASRNLQDDLEIILAALEQNKSSMKFASHEKQIQLSMSYKSFGSYSGYNNKNLILSCLEYNASLFKYISIELQNDEEVVCKAISNDGMILQFVNQKFRCNMEILITAVTHSGLSLQYADDAQRNNRNVVLAAVQQNGLALQYAHEKLLDDKEIVLAAVQQNGLALEFASSALKSNHEIVATSVSKIPESLSYASNELQNDASFLLLLIKNNAILITLIDNEFIEDTEFLCHAVQINEQSVLYLGEPYKNNKDLMFLLLSYNYRVFKFLQPEFQNDINFLAEAYRQEPNFSIEFNLQLSLEVSSLTLEKVIYKKFANYSGIKLNSPTSQQVTKKINQLSEAISRIKQEMQDNYLYIDEYYAEKFTSIISPENFDQLKIEFIQDWYNTKIPDNLDGNIDYKKIKIDDQQALVIGSVSKNTKVTARAGSGKTATLVMRALFLYRHCNVQWNEMLIMVFNNKAAKEVNKRIRGILNYWNESQFINVAHTFHSFALSIVGNVNLITDDEETITNLDEQSCKYTPQELIKDIHCQKIKRDPEIEMYELIISMRSFIGQYSGQQSATAYKLAIIFEKSDIDNDTNRKYKTLINNQQCDNEDEQLLGMLLSCCGVPFKYKKSLRLEKQTAIPIKFNFTIGDGDDKQRYIYDEINKFNEIKKTDYCKNAKLIKPDFVAIQEFINKVIDSIFTKSGEIHHLSFKIAGDLILSVLPYPELKQIFKFDPELYVQFINYARQIGYKPKEIRNRNIDFIHHYCGREYHDCEKRNSDIAKFVDTATDIYEIYMQRLEQEKRFDYTRLLEEAPSLIASGRRIKFGSNNAIEKLKYLFIDEYQDFSRLFYDLIHSIRKINPTLFSFCVGDDWQAINGFAGSDLKFFSDFNTYFPNSKELFISHNYRSKQKIVNLGNFIMQGKGLPSKAKDKAIGSIYLIDSNTFNLNKYEESHCGGDKFLASLLRIIQKHLNDGQSVALLSRTNSVKLSNKSYEAKELLAEIRKYFPDKSEFISYHTEDDPENKSNQTSYRVSTAHSFKGLEDDAVIILDLYRFPLVHPNYEYQKILGQTEQIIKLEEERLLYVAVTRPKSILYLMGFYPDDISERRRNDTMLRIDNFKNNNLVIEIDVSSYPPIVFPEDKFTLRLITPLNFSHESFKEQRKEIKNLDLKPYYVQKVFQFWYKTYHLPEFNKMIKTFETLSELAHQCKSLDAFVIVAEIDGHIIRYCETNKQISYFTFDFHLHKIANRDTESFIAMMNYYLETDKNKFSHLLNETSLGESLLSIVLIYPDAYEKITQLYQLIVDKYNYFTGDFKKIICSNKVGKKGFLDKAIYLELNELCKFLISIGITTQTNFDSVNLVETFNSIKDIKKRYELIEKFASWKIDFNYLLKFLIEESTAEYNTKLFYLHNILYIYQHDLRSIISSTTYQAIKGNYKNHDFINLVESYLQLDEIETTQIQNDILARNISCLVHFTTITNLQSILKDKQILSINQLQSSRDNFRSNYNYGNFKNHVFCSISVINNILLRNYKNSNFDNGYCILKIRPRYIYTKDTHYSPYYDEVEYSKDNLTIIGSSYGHFSNMFRDSLERLINDKLIIINRENISIPDNQTTDRQAEVLIPKSIHIIEIFEIVVETQGLKEQILRDIPNFHKDFPWIDIMVDTNSFKLPPDFSVK